MTAMAATATLRRRLQVYHSPHAGGNDSPALLIARLSAPGGVSRGLAALMFLKVKPHNIQL